MEAPGLAVPPRPERRDSPVDSTFCTTTRGLALADVSAFRASSLRRLIALGEICVGVVAAAVTGFLSRGEVLTASRA